MASNPILKISNVSRTFGAIQALKEANFEIAGLFVVAFVAHRHKVLL